MKCMISLAALAAPEHVLSDASTHPFSQAHTAHTQLPCLESVAQPSGAASKPRTGKSSAKVAVQAAAACVPDVARVLSDVCELGAGMVEGVWLPASCHKLPLP